MRKIFKKNLTIMITTSKNESDFKTLINVQFEQLLIR